jgi:hypothetical protein
LIAHLQLTARLFDTQAQATVSLPRDRERRFKKLEKETGGTVAAEKAKTEILAGIPTATGQRRDIMQVSMDQRRNIMRLSTNFALPVAAVLFGLLLVPRAALAQAHIADCPQEPQTNVTIASGDVYSGSNCTLYTPGDVDGFVFSANNGDTYQLVLGYQGGPTNVCLTLYNPDSVVIIPETCTSSDGIVEEKTLTITGKYNVFITEPEGGGQAVDSYALSLERINPVPPDAQPIKLSDEVAGTIAAPTEQNAFTFYGTTTGTYQVTTTYTGGPINVCTYLYYPDSITPSTLSGCTSANSYQFQFTPTQDATYMLLINGAGNDATVNYNLEVVCLLGTCGPPPPSCTLTDALTYNASTSTLTMNFTVGNNEGTTETWNAWLTYQNTIIAVPGFPISQPVTNPPVPITKTYTGLPAEGKVGVLSTLTTPKKGITCSSWVQISTGTGP